MARARITAPDRGRRLNPVLAQSFYLTPHDGWVIATAVVGNVACALVGCFLVLRRMSLLGDAISHAILPGIAAAFIVTGSRDPLPMMAGALAAGLLTAAISSGLARGPRVSEDSALGLVFTGMFAVGVLMITWVARDIDLDPGCVLYGLIDSVPFDMVQAGPVRVPRALLWLSAVLVVNTAAIVVFFKELRLVAFDPSLATTMGISAGVVHYGLMMLVAGTSVAAFESVGSILVVTMLVAPGAAAHLLTDRLDRMLLWSALIAAIAAVGGYLLALLWNTSVAGMMSVVAGAEFGLAALFAPRHGYAARQWRRLDLAVQIALEDLLGALFRRHEGSRAALPALDGVVGRWAARRARRGGWVRFAPGGPELTPSGLARARQVVQAHRLWESFLAERLGLPEDHLHDPSERVEHFISPGMREQLAREVSGPHDPRGRAEPPGD